MAEAVIEQCPHRVLPVSLAPVVHPDPDPDLCVLLVVVDLMEPADADGVGVDVDREPRRILVALLDPPLVACLDLLQREGQRRQTEESARTSIVSTSS